MTAGIVPCAIDGGQVHVTAPLPGPSGLTSLVEQLREASREAPLVAIVPTWAGDRQLALWRTARSLVGAERVIVVTTPLPPVAAGLTTALVGAIRASLAEPARVATAVHTVAREVVSLAWVRTVTGLEHVPVPLAMHARSYVTRSGFVAHVTPDPSVHPAGSGVDLDLPPGSVAVVAATKDPTGWQEGDLRAALADTSVLATEVPDSSAPWWGTDSFVEVAVGPGDLEALTTRVRAATDGPRCPWCASTVATATCMRCGRARDGDPTPPHLPHTDLSAGLALPTPRDPEATS